jgi:nucleoporin NDC1
MGIPLAAKRAFKLSTVAFIFSAVLLEIIPHPFKCSIGTQAFFTEQFVFFVASLAIFFCWELTHNLHRVGVFYLHTCIILDSCFHLA